MEAKEKLIFINNCLSELRKRVEAENIVNADFIRFQDGSGKVVLPTICRGQDVYIICDVNDKTPNPYTGHVLSPDDHVRDITRVIGALKENPARKTLIVPFQPYGRQHRREPGESIEAADFLRECHYLGFHNILTVDSHNPDTAAAISKHNFDNMFLTNELLTAMVTNESIDYNRPQNILIVAPDEGADKRAKYFASRFGCGYAAYDKDRDKQKVVDGKNPVKGKVYRGRNPENQTIIIVDDMISSGGSVLAVAKDLKNKRAKRIFICSTFGLFTEGTEKFVEYYNSGIIDGTYISNLTYIKPQPLDGINIVDGTERILNYIHAMHENKEDLEEELGLKAKRVDELVRIRRNGK